MKKPHLTITTAILALILLMLFVLPVHAADSAGVSGYLFVDGDINGLPEANDKRLSGVEVALIKTKDSQSIIVATQTTGADGGFSFSALPAGTYRLQVMLPKNHVPTLFATEGSQALPGSGPSASTPVFALSEGDNKSNMLIGAALKSSVIKVIAFGDENANSGRFSTEPLLKDVLVELVYEHEGTQYIVGSAQTDKEGTATIRDITPGTYRIAVTMPDPYIIGPVGPKLSLFYNAIVPADSNRGLSAPITLPAGGSLGIGAGGVLTGKVQGKVWLDANFNGKQEAGETGAEGLTIQLTNPTGDVSRNVVTGQDGSYLFERLQAGSYQLTAAVPEHLMFTVPGDSLFANGFITKDVTNLSVELGKATAVQSIGVIPATQLTVQAFHDQNVDGLLSEGEQAFAGALVEIMTNQGVEAKMETNAEGIAHFPNVRGGNFKIRCTLKDEQIFSIPAENGNAFSSSAAENIVTIDYSLPHGTHAKLLAGVTLPSAISGTVFDDSNLNGIHDADETFHSQFSIAAINAEGQAVSTAKTDENGVYLLEKLVPGEYKVRVSLVSPFVFSNASSTGAAMENKIITQTPEHGETDAIRVQPGETLGNVDAAVFRSAIINGKVLLGDAKDGFSGTLGGLAGVDIVLLDEEGNPVSDHTIAKTDAAGAFSLKGALPDTYMLQYKLPEKTAFSNPLTDDTTWTSLPFTLKSSDVMEANPLFVVKTGTISGKAFEDANADGVYSEGETALKGATIKLTSESGVTLDIQTSEEGDYLFSGLRPGAYKAEVVLQSNQLVSYAENNLVPPALASASSGNIDIAMGMEKAGLNIAASPQAKLDVHLFYDNDLSQTHTDVDTPHPFTDITITHVKTGVVFQVNSGEQGLLSIPTLFTGAYTFSLSLPEDHVVYAPAATKQAGDNWTGSFSITQADASLAIGLVQHGSLSGAVWNLDGSTTSISGLPVMLFDAKTNQQVAKTATGAKGDYQFKTLNPGQYYIKATIPGGYRYARQLDASQRASIIVSDNPNVVREAGQSDIFTLAMGENKANQDIGIGAMGRLGDIAWLDLDNDGMQDTGEPGIPGLTIKLYQYGQFAAETTTDMYGKYLFKELYPGEYSMEIALPPELKTTRRQTTFPLIASILPENQENVARAEGIVVPSNARNLNCDLGFALRTPGKYPANMQALPTKDWTPLVPYTPTR